MFQRTTNAVSIRAAEKHVQRSTRILVRIVGSVIVSTILLNAGCATFSPPDTDTLPQTSGEKNAGYAYIPLDPLPVVSVPDVNRGCAPDAPVSRWQPILEALPDNAVRVAVGSFDASGTVTFGPVQIGTKGNNYQVVLDYINVDTSNVYFDIWYTARDTGDVFPIYDVRPTGRVSISALRIQPGSSSKAHGDIVIIPVYVGLGLRLTATVNVVEGSVNLSSLGAIAAEAQAGRVTGSLVVQTLGITGRQVTASLPLPSELNSTTVQNAILSLGAIKAVLYDSDAIKTPRVTGIYNPIGVGGQGLINAIVSELAKEPIEWKRPCRNSESR